MRKMQGATMVTIKNESSINDSNTQEIPGKDKKKPVPANNQVAPAVCTATFCQKTLNQ